MAGAVGEESFHPSWACFTLALCAQGTWHICRHAKWTVQAGSPRSRVDMVPANRAKLQTTQLAAAFPLAQHLQLLQHPILTTSTAGGMSYNWLIQAQLSANPD